MSFTYDTRGRKLTETNPDTGFKWWSYDALGEVLSYSQNNTVVTITPSSTTSYEREGYTYDNLGRVTTRTDAGGVTTTWTYDSAPGGSASSGICIGLVASVTTRKLRGQTT